MERIDIYVDDIDEIFNQFDHNDINDCLAEYIENRCSRIRKNELEINIYTNEKLNSDIKDRCDEFGNAATNETVGNKSFCFETFLFEYKPFDF